MDSVNLTVFFLFAFLAGHGVFLSFALIRSERGSRSDGTLLGILLLLTLIRVGKSVAALGFPDYALPVSVIGLVSMAAMGPVLVLYIKRLFYTTKKTSALLALHFVPSGIACFLWSWKFLNPGYYLITLQFLFYLGAAIAMLLRHRTALVTDNVRWKWALTTAGGLIMLSITFVSQLFIYDRFLYVVIIILSLVFYYVLAIWLFSQQRSFQNESKRSHGESDVPEYKTICVQIEALMQEEVFTDPSLNLTSLSKRVNKPAYVVSRAINEQLNKTFPELLIFYRIRKAEEMLLSPLSKTYTIEGIAYECGFSTLSAFYTAFKKATGMTPSQFKKTGGPGKMKIA